ncbi:MAG: CCA tRNA nucleotidyltransferase [Oscillospiraceae bacterium]|nr:CCA tRNA nucleotidyltransferase [Oscillospiraceae bacterium]
MTTLPNFLLNTLETIEAAGHSAYLVGGPVRDLVMGKTPDDWDITTSATPEAVMGLFPKTVPTGLKHGTVTVLIDGRSIEVTTFRRDGAYTDHRHPEEVNFVTDLREDLSRRDFTINAMALSRTGELIDFFGGRVDLAAGLIRAVGDPLIRFEEDALRMFRALRFSAQLGFSIDPPTLSAIWAKRHLAGAISAERVRTELEKILLSSRPERIAEVFYNGLLADFAPHPMPTLDSLGQVPAQKHPRWACFTAVLMDYSAIEPTAFLRSLRLDNKTIHVAGTAATLGPSLPAEPIALKHLLSRYGAEVLTVAAEVAVAYDRSEPAKALENIFQSGDCYSLQTLAVTGADLIAVGHPPGPVLGELLATLLNHVIRHPAANRRSELLRLAKTYTGKA